MKFQYTVIIAAALMDRDGNIYALPSPNRHHDVMRLFKLRNEMIHQTGFLLSNGTFVNRAQAFRIASSNGQLLSDAAYLIRHSNSRPYNIDDPDAALYSEDLW